MTPEMTPVMPPVMTPVIGRAHRPGLASLTVWLCAALAALLPPPAHAQAPAPAISVPVTDLANALPAADEAALDAKLRALRDQTGVQMAILVLRSLDGAPIEDFAHATFARWGGGSATRDDGLLLVVATLDRRKRLEVGYGLEPLIPDSAAADLLGAMNPLMAEERYGEAMVGLVEGLSARVAHLTPEAVTIGAPHLAAEPLAPVILAILGWLAASLIQWRHGRPAPAVAAPRMSKRARRKARARGEAPTPPAPATTPSIPSHLSAALWIFVPLGLWGLVWLIDSELVVAYLAVWFASALCGLFHGWLHHRGPVRRVLAFVVVALHGLALWAGASEARPVTTSWAIAELLLPLLCLLALILGLMSLHRGAPGGRGAGWSIGVGGGSGGSTYVASSTSSDSGGYSSASDSSSSSDSDWSGGGGDSGGGGASDSW
jgi:uncharacterized protein